MRCRRRHDGPVADLHACVEAAVEGRADRTAGWYGAPATAAEDHGVERASARWRPVTSGQIRRPNARALPLGAAARRRSAGGRSLGGPALAGGGRRGSAGRGLRGARDQGAGGRATRRWNRWGATGFEAPSSRPTVGRRAAPRQRWRRCASGLIIWSPSSPPKGVEPDEVAFRSAAASAAARAGRRSAR